LEHGEILVFIKEKCNEHVAILNKVGLWYMFETIVVKWRKFSTTFMATSFSKHTRKRPACKDKWGIISGDFKKVFLLHVTNCPWPKLLDIKLTREGYIPFATIFSQEFLRPVTQIHGN
jgi:hypothetical protein